MAQTGKFWSLFRKSRVQAGPPPSSLATSPPTSLEGGLPGTTGGTRDAEATRRHGFEDGPNTGALPTDGGGVERVERYRLKGEDLSGDVTMYRPILVGRREPANLSFIFGRPPEIADSEDVPHLRFPLTFEHDGSVMRAQVALPAGTSCYGTGGQTGPLLRNRRTVRLWNTDAWRYGDASPALYQSHPYVLAVFDDGSAIGVIADSTRRGAILCCDDGIEFQFEEEPFDVYIIEGADPAAVTRTLTLLIGSTPLPPRWALGYHQSRWSYGTAAEVLHVAKVFRERNIPCDAIWLDIDHAERFRAFTWDKRTFPDPAGMVRLLHERGFKVVTILDPGIAVDPTYDVHVEGNKGGHWITDARHRPVKGRVWPGLCTFPDFTRDETRDWWASKVADFAKVGVDGIWNDMNEPSVFRAPLNTLPDDARHAGFGGGPHRKFHNVYGMLMARASRKGMLTHAPEKRPFVLTRASFLGGQRYAASWTGDNQARWEDLRWSISMALNLGLCGQAFTGADIGGFDGDPSPELFVRWFELGALLPFCRGHSEKSACRKEPWAFGEAVERQVSDALDRRMRLLPTLYTLFREAETKGLPVVRPVFFADPADPRLRAIDDAFLLGADLLVAPIVEPDKRARDVVLPAGQWFDFHMAGGPLEGSVTVDAPLGRPPIFARAGCIVVEGPAGNCVGQIDKTSLTLHVFLDHESRAVGKLYEDAGDGFEYASGAFRKARYDAEVRASRFNMSMTIAGHFQTPERTLTILVHGATADGSVLRLSAPEQAAVSLPI